MLVRHKQQTTPGGPASRSGLTQTNAKSTGGSVTNASGSAGTSATAGVSNNVALPPQVVAAQAQALQAMLDGSTVSLQALDFYRIPLFLLPIYQAAAVQYDVPWPILAAINEIETDYGTDLSVSSAGAEGWMQFEPGTAAVRGRRAERRLRRPIQPGRRDLRGGALPERGGRGA